MKLNTYLHFDGQCREAFETYARVLGGKVAALMTYGEAPMGGKQCTKAAGGRRQVAGGDSPGSGFSCRLPPATRHLSLEEKAA